MSRPYDFTTPIPNILGDVDKLQAVNALRGQQQAQQLNALAIQAQQGDLANLEGRRNALAQYATDPTAGANALMQYDPALAQQLQQQQAAEAQARVEAKKAAAIQAATAFLDIPQDQRETAGPQIRQIVESLGVDISDVPGPTGLDDDSLRMYITALGGQAPEKPGIMSIPLTSRGVNEATGEVVVPAEPQSDTASAPPSIQEYRLWAGQQPEGVPNGWTDYLRATTAATTRPQSGAGQYTLTDVRNLNNDWNEAAQPVRDLKRQADLMEVGMQAARAGDMAAGSQAVLVTFQKILDPTSVVRESEYARSASGLALLDQIQGAVERLREGGAGVPLTQLESFYRLANNAVEKLNNGYLQQERTRLEGVADFYRIPRHLVFEGDVPIAGREEIEGFRPD